MRTRRALASLPGLVVALALAACGGAATATPTVNQPATVTAVPSPTLLATAPAATQPAQPLLPARPTNAAVGSRTITSLPLPGGQGPTPAALSAGAVAANSDGSCPPEQPVKAVGLGKSYHLQDQASYGRVRAGECFATESAAQAAGYRKAAR